MELVDLAEQLIDQLDDERALSTAMGEIAETQTRRIRMCLRGIRSLLPGDSEVTRDLDSVIDDCGALVATVSGLRDDLDRLLQDNDHETGDLVGLSESALQPHSAEGIETPCPPGVLPH